MFIIYFKIFVSNINLGRRVGVDFARQVDSFRSEQGSTALGSK